MPRRSPPAIAAALALAACVSPPGPAKSQEIPTATTPKPGPRPHGASEKIKEDHQQLRRAFREQAARRAAGEPVVAEVAAPGGGLPAPQRRDLAESSSISFQNPEEIRSADGQLKVTLVAMKTHGRIGDDPVFLRSYNGRLVGPTLRARPGDILRIKLVNDLEPEVHHAGDFNTIHKLNTTNLHTHGLHVSPNGISDNVLLEVNPQSTQDYEIKIPDDHVAGTFWYHAHRHGSTAVQVGSGMSGALIIDGGMDAIPEIAAIRAGDQRRDRVFMLQQIPYAYNTTIRDQQGQVIHSFNDLPEGIIEVEQADAVLAPRAWPQLGRFTTINGIRLPVLRVRPGSLERWRFVHAGTRETIRLQLEKAKGGPAAPEAPPLNEIARDGVPLGRMIPMPRIDMYPGYRSDVLFRAPDAAGAEYLLADAEVEAGRTVLGDAKPRRYLARIIVEGEPDPMPLPRDEQLAPFLPPSLGDPTEVETPETVKRIVYGATGGNPLVINGKSYDGNTSQSNQVYRLGDIVERTLTAEGFLHVFHIHVNPFEIIKTTGSPGGDIPPGQSYWRDTIALAPGEEVTIRMELKDFAGLFVQHCHLLQHEDLGMMDLVEIRPPAQGAVAARPRVPEPYPAPRWDLAAADGTRLTSDRPGDRPTLMVFFEGFGCVRCNEQLVALSARKEWFRARGVDLVAISSDTKEDLVASAREAKFDFPLAADPDGRAFRAFGCFAAGSPLHGIFLLDASRRVVWQDVSTRPWADIDALLKEFDNLLPRANVTIR
ncbi:multicopper oxidase domain-containing protein [Tundrisphaera sp. TA3]|uniref:multicopper oxidase domain-containing protein n=1 Tax=Tundrisphaera sp. TA3 TaxID=3435775 RepID=UPI003EBE1DE2